MSGTEPERLRYEGTASPTSGTKTSSTRYAMLSCRRRGLGTFGGSKFTGRDPIAKGYLRGLQTGRPSLSRRTEQLLTTLRADSARAENAFAAKFGWTTRSAIVLIFEINAAQRPSIAVTHDKAAVLVFRQTREESGGDRPGSLRLPLSAVNKPL
jgi:hypothetical protein